MAAASASDSARTPLQEFNPLAMDLFIIGYMTKAGISWADLVKIHSDQRGSKEISLDGVPLEAKEILQYIRALSRIIIQYNVSLHKISNPNFYAIIAGSTNIASDYDVTLVGEGASMICQKIVSSFRKHTGGDLADIADSNVYIAPAFVVERGREYPDWLKQVMIGDDQAFPLPDSELSIQKEIRAVLKRDGFKDSRSIAEKYDSMISKGERLESTYYYPRGTYMDTEINNEANFWDLLHGINFDAMEAYITLSTIIAVVVELQMKKTIKELQSIHYFISAFENMINFIDHNGGLDTSDSVKLLKNSKYIHRIVHCLAKSDLASEVGSIDAENVKYIVSQRGSPSDNLYSSPEFKQFEGDVRVIMGLRDTIRGSLEARLSPEPAEVPKGKRKRRKQGKRKTRKIRRNKRRV